MKRVFQPDGDADNLERVCKGRTKGRFQRVHELREEERKTALLKVKERKTARIENALAVKEQVGSVYFRILPPTKYHKIVSPQFLSELFGDSAYLESALRQLNHESNNSATIALYNKEILEPHELMLAKIFVIGHKDTPGILQAYVADVFSKGRTPCRYNPPLCFEAYYVSVFLDVLKNMRQSTPSEISTYAARFLRSSSFTWPKQFGSEMVRIIVGEIYVELLYVEDSESDSDNPA